MNPLFTGIYGVYVFILKSGKVEISQRNKRVE